MTDALWQQTTRNDLPFPGRAYFQRLSPRVTT